LEKLLGLRLGEKPPAIPGMNRTPHLDERPRCRLHDAPAEIVGADRVVRARPDGARMSGGVR